jgi:hypothetical protein
LVSARACPLQQGFEARSDEFERSLGVLVAALAFFSTIGDALLEAFEIGEHQFGLDRLGVGDRIDLAFDVGDVVVLEAAQHVAIASTSRMLARNWLPRPSPFEAPRTRPAMSTKFSRVG